MQAAAVGFLTYCLHRIQVDYTKSDLAKYKTLKNVENLNNLQTEKT